MFVIRREFENLDSPPLQRLNVCPMLIKGKSQIGTTHAGTRQPIRKGVAWSPNDHAHPAVLPLRPLSVKSLLVVRDPEQAACLLHPLRQRLLVALRQPSSAARLAKPMGITRQLLVYHLHCLEEARLIRFIEERQVRQMKERVLQAVAEKFLLDPVLLGELSPSSTPLTDPTSPAQLAGLLQTASAEAVGGEAPTLALCFDMGFVGREERIEAFQSIANSAQKIARTHERRGADDQYRLVVGVIKPGQ